MEHVLEMQYPASWWHDMWREGLVVGNGITGVNLYGGAKRETLQIGRHDLWYNGSEEEVPDVHEAFLRLRRKMDEGNFGEAKALNPDGRLAYGVPLVGPDGKSGHVLNQALTFRTHFSKELCEDTERFGRLLEFIDYVNGSDVAGDMTPVLVSYFGKEGQNWEWSEDNLVRTLLPEDKTWDDVELDGWRGTFTFMEEGGSLEFQKLRKASDGSGDWIENLTKDYPKGYSNKLYKNLETASEYKAELDKLLNEGYISIITGEKPLEYFDEMVELWYDNGGQEMTDEVNEWYGQYQD